MLEKINKALEYLTTIDVANLGNAAEYLDTDCEELHRSIQVLFPVAMVLHAFTKLPNYLRAEHRSYSEHLADYLQKQVGSSRGFNYWIRGSESDKKFPLPDDVDDSACALVALSLQGVSLEPDYFLRLLSLETRPGGPYRTWYIDPASDAQNLWGDVDVVVNAHLLYFCGVEQIKLANTRKFLLQQIQRDSYASRYYPYLLTGLFYAAKYAAAVKDRLMLQLLLQKLGGLNWDSFAPMERLLYLLSLSYLKQPISQERLDLLTSLQEEDGSFPAWPMCYGFEMSGNVPTYVGSKINSTALMLELMSMHLEPVRVQVAQPQSRYIAELADQISADFEQLQLQKVFTEQEVLRSRAVNLPLQLAFALLPNISPAQIALICDYSASLSYGWAGYTLLDKILDKELDLRYLPAMLALQRLSQDRIKAVTDAVPEIQTAIEEAYLKCDNYYRWELRFARFSTASLPRLIKRSWTYRYIGDRMQPFIAAMTWLPKLLGLDYNPQMAQFWKSLVVIDQLNDDAHDYRDDYASGAMTYVLWNICRLNSDPTTHDATFWNAVMPLVYADAMREHAKAMRAIKGHAAVELMQQLLDFSIAPIIAAERESQAVKSLAGFFDKNPD